MLFSSTNTTKLFYVLNYSLYLTILIKFSNAMELKKENTQGTGLICYQCKKIGNEISAML